MLKNLTICNSSLGFALLPLWIHSTRSSLARLNLLSGSFIGIFYRDIGFIKDNERVLTTILSFFTSAKHASLQDDARNRKEF